MYNGLAHTGFGAMLLTVAAAVIGGVGAALRFMSGSGRG